LDVGQGDIVTIVGKNGSGKTTLTRILSTLVTPERGEAIVCGFDVVREPRQVRKRIGVLLNAGMGGFHARLSGKENLEYYGALYQIPQKEAGERIKALLADLELQDRGADQFQSYSTGMRRRLALARALLPNAPVVLLDEPTLGVDPWSTEQVHKLLLGLVSEGKTIFCTTNNMSEAKTLGKHVFLLDEGKLSPISQSEVMAS